MLWGVLDLGVWLGSQEGFAVTSALTWDCGSDGRLRLHAGTQ